MHIAVFVKQVPDTTDVKIDPKTGTLMREGIPSIINPFDMYAIEEALRIKEKAGGKVTVVTMGPPQAVDALREAISYGVDECILVSDRAFAGADTLATSHTLSAAIKKMGDVDLIICGKQAIDGDTAQVGPGIAEWLNIPFVAFAGKVEIIDNTKLKVYRMTEMGHDVVELPLPAAITVVKEINEPRMPSLKGKMRAKSYNPVAWKAADLEVDKLKIGLDGSPTRVYKVFSPKTDRKSEMIHGDSIHEMVDKLSVKLEEAKLI